jgi:hypothetical protein
MLSRLLRSLVWRIDYRSLSCVVLLVSLALLGPAFSEDDPSPSGQTDEPIEIGPPVGLGKQQGDICYTGHCQVCKIDSDGACLDCSDDPTCDKPEEPSPGGHGDSEDGNN